MAFIIIATSQGIILNAEFHYDRSHIRPDPAHGLTIRHAYRGGSFIYITEADQRLRDQANMAFGAAILMILGLGLWQVRQNRLKK